MFTDFKELKRILLDSRTVKLVKDLTKDDLAGYFVARREHLRLISEGINVFKDDAILYSKKTKEEYPDIVMLGSKIKDNSDGDNIVIQDVKLLKDLVFDVMIYQIVMGGERLFDASYTLNYENILINPKLAKVTPVSNLDVSNLLTIAEGIDKITYNNLFDQFYEKTPEIKGYLSEVLRAVETLKYIEDNKIFVKVGPKRTRRNQKISLRPYLKETGYLEVRVEDKNRDYNIAIENMDIKETIYKNLMLKRKTFIFDSISESSMIYNKIYSYIESIYYQDNKQFEEEWGYAHELPKLEFLENLIRKQNKELQDIVLLPMLTETEIALAISENKEEIWNNLEPYDQEHIKPIKMYYNSEKEIRHLAYVLREITELKKIETLRDLWIGKHIPREHLKEEEKNIKAGWTR